MDSFLKDVRPTTWRVLALVIVVSVGTSVLLNFVVGPVDSNVRNALGSVERATGGLVQPPLVVGPFYFAMMGTVISGIGRHRFSDVGWRPQDAGPGLLVTLGFWVAMQPALVIWVLVTAIVWFMLTANLVLAWLPVRRWWDRSAGDTSARVQ